MLNQMRIRLGILAWAMVLLTMTTGVAQAQDKADQWVPFAPGPDDFAVNSAIDLRGLNEKVAGENGFIQVAEGKFVHEKTHQPERFWAVNGPPADLAGEPLKHTARFMAKYGINLARLHGGIYDPSGEIDPKLVARKIQTIAALKAEGIYTHLSIYFPLWLQPKPATPWLEGYDGKKHPFAVLYFNPAFQAQYRKWWQALLTTPDQQGRKLIDDPAIMGVEIVNEDSYFFWTFNSDNIPDVQLRILEEQFAVWLTKKYGSADAAIGRWGGRKEKRDNLAEGRVAFRPLWNLFKEKTARDKDTVAFLAEGQRAFYEQTVRFLRELGFKGVITASNWTTANNEVLGPVERWTYTAGDFVDRHGYFGGTYKGPFADWSMRDGHTYADRSALRMEGAEPGQAKSFVHPVMEIRYDGKPTMISETSWTRPNRYRSEAPLFYAAYGALQGTDAIVHFALDGPTWSVKPGYFMQPWTLMSPAMMGQFPAAALIYRKGLIAPAEVLAEINLPVADVLNLKGSPLPQDASFDALRLKDVPTGQQIKPGNVIDPLIHFAGRTSVNFVPAPVPVGVPAPVPDKLADLSKLIDRAHSTVRSSTGQVKLNYAIGLLTIDAPAAQAVSGMLGQAGKVETTDLTVDSAMELGHIVAVSLDGRPLANSGRILLQVMSEEQATGFKTQPVSAGVKRIVSIGRNPWTFGALQGKVSFKRPDAQALNVQPLDYNGHPSGDPTTGGAITLRRETVYYLITK